jgi:prophage regulatory protein
MNNTAPPIHNDRLLRQPEVTRLTGLKRSTLYSLMSKGKFPRPVKITEKAVAWRFSEIRQWISSL